MRALLAVFLLSLFASVNAVSGSSAPAQSEAAGRQEASAEQHEKHSSTDKRVSKNLPAEVEIAPSAVIKMDVSDKTEKHNDYSSSEWWLVYLTGFLTLVTAFLALYTGKLFRATVTLGEDARNTAERQSNLERPWLFMEAVRVERREGAPIQPQISNNWYISFKWRNIGRSPALIEDCIFKIEDRNSLPQTPDYANSGQLTCPSTVAAGVEFETSQVGPAPEKGMKDGEPVNLTVYGRLTYKELNGKLHHTGFAMDVSPHVPAASTNKCKGYEYYD